MCVLGSLKVLHEALVSLKEVRGGSSALVKEPFRVVGGVGAPLSLAQFQASLSRKKRVIVRHAPYHLSVRTNMRCSRRAGQVQKMQQMAADVLARCRQFRKRHQICWPGAETVVNSSKSAGQV